MSKTPEQTVGEEIIEGLTELRDHLATGRPLADKFTVRTAHIGDMRCRPIQEEQT